MKTRGDVVLLPTPELPGYVSIPEQEQPWSASPRSNPARLS